MKNQYHILNGDALKDQFPESISGEIIVARECLVDGPVQGETLSDFFNERARFISTEYEGFSGQDYFSGTVPEFRKIQKIPKDIVINLWFEDDLFCQVNLWFVVFLLTSSDHLNLYLIRPQVHTPCGFGGLNSSELNQIYANRQKLTGLDSLSKLWEFYKANDQDGLIATAKKLQDTYPFLLPAVQAHIDRLPSNGNPGRPKSTLLQLMKDLDSDELGPIFREFCRREPIYGFGDLQVKRLLDELRNA